MGSEYFYTRDGEQFGPVASEQLKSLAKSGQLQPSDLVWKEGMPDWVEVRSIKSLLTLLPQSASQPPPLPATRAKLAATSAVATSSPHSTEPRPFDFEAIAAEGRALGGFAAVKAAEIGKNLQANAHRLRENPFVVGASLFLCLPIGLYLVWTHSVWTTNRKLAWTGVFTCVFIVSLFGSSSDVHSTTTSITPDLIRQEWNRGTLYIGAPKSTVRAILGSPERMDDLPHEGLMESMPDESWSYCNDTVGVFYKNGKLMSIIGIGD